MRLYCSQYLKSKCRSIDLCSFSTCFIRVRCVHLCLVRIVICLSVVAFLPIMLAWVGGYFRHKQLGVVDNKTPRLQALQLTGVGHCAYAAQQNAWEALMLFSAALLALSIGGVDFIAVKNLCVIFVS